VLDEAQDLSAMQYRAVGRRCSTGSVTVLGDIAQGTTPWATPSWAETLKHLGKPEAVVEELTLGFRVPRQIIDFAARLLPDAAPRIVVVPATLAKGLEYDQVIVVEPAEIVAAEPRGLRRLYVVLTRAVSRLHVLHAEPLPSQLTD